MSAAVTVVCGKSFPATLAAPTNEVSCAPTFATRVPKGNAAADSTWTLMAAQDDDDNDNVATAIDSLPRRFTEAMTTMK